MSSDKQKFQKSLDSLISESKVQRDINWEGPMVKYMELVHDDPTVARPAPARIFEMIFRAGTSDVAEPEKLPHYEDLVRYNFFDGEIFGIEEVLHDLVRFFRAGANRTETGKRIPVPVGPVSSGKSTIASVLRKGLEQSEIPMYSIKDCPIHEGPLHLVPRSLRPEFEELPGVRIEGELCAACKVRLTNDEAYRDGGDNVKWENMPEVRLRLSERSRVGIATFQPSDPRNQDISELIGHVDLGQITRYGEGHPAWLQG